MFKVLTNIIIVIGIAISGTAQVVYHHISNEHIYNFLDELAVEQVIELSSGVKPYSSISSKEFPSRR